MLGVGVGWQGKGVVGEGDLFTICPGGLHADLTLLTQSASSALGLPTHGRPGGSLFIYVLFITLWISFLTFNH